MWLPITLKPIDILRDDRFDSLLRCRHVLLLRGVHPLRRVMRVIRRARRLLSLLLTCRLRLLPRLLPPPNMRILQRCYIMFSLRCRILLRNTFLLRRTEGS